MKANKNKLKITKEQIMVMNRTINREIELESGNRINHHKVHKSATDYNRKREKKVVFDY
jgi:hypothetical protein